MARGDMFLKIETAKQGAIKGESQDGAHKNEIDVVGWSWGMQAHTSLGAAGNAPKATVSELDILKRVDSASTALMSALRNNDLVKKAILIVRKSGASPLEYVKITVQDGRITALNVESAETELRERLTLSFKRINVEYTPQGEDGRARGSMSFETDIT
jgi:type VI secretion system secreted protein Hcp